MSRDSGYPPGVTGNEYEIAGPDKEWEEERTCSNEDCGFSGLVNGETYNNTEAWTCPQCGRAHDAYVGPDPDDYDDREDECG